MRKSRDRDKKVALACGLGVLAVAGLIVLSWDGIHAWYVGYRFVWLPEGVLPVHRGQPINESGEVAVDLLLEPMGTRAGHWSLAQREVLLLDLPLAGNEWSKVSAINDVGDIVVQVRPQLGLYLIEGNLLVRPLLWTKNAGMRELAVLGVAMAINERGQVVGLSIWPPNNDKRAFLWSAESGSADLGSLAPGQESHATSINEVGWVVGKATAADGSRHPFLWKPETGMQDLGLPSGFDDGDAEHINDQGEVLVCFYKQTIGTPFLWRESSGFIKLPAPSGLNGASIVALNNQGAVLLASVAFDEWMGHLSNIGCVSHLIVNGVLKELPRAPEATSTTYYGLNDRGWLVGAAQKSESAPWRGFVALPVR